LRENWGHAALPQFPQAFTVRFVVFKLSVWSSAGFRLENAAWLPEHIPCSWLIGMVWVLVPGDKFLVARMSAELDSCVVQSISAVQKGVLCAHRKVGDSRMSLHPAQTSFRSVIADKFQVCHRW
jgi:hypothetical protein